MKKIIENTIEAFAIKLLERLGYQYLYAPEIDPYAPKSERYKANPQKTEL